jgi:hypothetical protein
MAIWGTTLIDAGADNMMYAVDARTGKLVWETKVLDPKLPARATAGPIVVNGKVITGRQCQPAATNDSCIITAHDAATGKELWRTRTIPKKGDPGDETWGNVPMEQRWHVGTWMVPSYDPELDRIYIGTSVTIPAPKFILGGSAEPKFDHPTQKPLELMRRPILNHTRRGALVYEPFRGSGTTLAAAELTGRVCYASELDPKYADVAIERWQGLCGQQAKLDGDGRSFSQIKAARVPVAA